VEDERIGVGQKNVDFLLKFWKVELSGNLEFSNEINEAPPIGEMLNEVAGNKTEDDIK